MLKASEIERVSMVLDKPLRDLEMQIMEDIVRRIKINGEITRSADWQIYRLHELGMSKREIKKAIAKAEAELGEDGRVLVRVSGTEPLVRVMLEGKDEKLIEKLCDEIAEVVRERLI